jgi:hypothetical protein
VHLLVASELCIPDGRFHDADGLVVDLDGNRVGVPVLAAVRQREPGRIPEAVGRRARPRPPSPANEPCARRRRASAADRESRGDRARLRLRACHAAVA